MPVKGTGSARRYPANVMRFAVRLAAEGYRPFQIEAALNQQGYRPSKATIKRWIDPDYLAWDRARHRQPFTRREVKCSARRVIRARMQTLRSFNVSFRAIAAIINHDFHLDLSGEDARSILNGRVSEASIRLLLDGHRPRRQSSLEEPAQ